MKRRMIDGGIWANEKFAEMPCMARLLQIGLINMADDQGRLKAHPAYLRSQLFPYDDVSLDDIHHWLQLIAANGTAVIYETDGKEYIQLVNWWQYQSLQYASPSEYPRPDGWQDRIRYNAKGNVTLTCNWTTVNGEQLRDLCDQNGDPLPIVATLPPRNPGGRPPKNPGGNRPENPGENPGENVNKDQIKININKDQERDHARVTETPETNSLPSSLLIYREFNKGDIEGIVTDAITSTVTDLDLWRLVLEKWKLRGYNTGNVTGLLDWYRDGIPPAGKNGANHGSNTKRSEPDDSDDAPKLDPELQRQFAELRERKRAKAQSAT